MVTFAQLRQATPERYRTAAAAWGRLVAAIDTQGGAVRAVDLGAGWDGAAARAATAHLARLGQNLGDAAALAGRVPAILDRHAAEVAAAKVIADQVVAAVSGSPIRLSQDGAVSLAPQAYAVPAMVPLWESLAGQVQTVVTGAVQRATAADAAATGELRAVVPTGTTVATGPAATPTVPARGTDPRTVNQWWQGLTGPQREALLLEHPELIGNLDGIPAVDRDRANRVVLATERTRLESLRARADGDERADLDDKLTGIAAIEARLNATGPGLQRPFLLGFDTAGHGHAIVAMGNPDTATNVVTFVPGTGTRLGTIGGDLARSDALVGAATLADRDQTTSAITWVGYDAPQDVINTDLGHLGEDATNPRYAQVAGPVLDRFQDGLRVTHDGPPSHNTVLGHSYGSTVVGFTARDQGLDVDEVVFVGSPGVGVQHAADLGLSPAHVWSSTARNDPIQYGYDFGDLVRAGLGIDPQVDLVHGANPSAPGFGGQVFAANPGDPLVRWEWERHGPFGGIPVPVPHFSAHAHSQYWDPNSASLLNLGEIIVGQRPTHSG